MDSRLIQIRPDYYKESKQGEGLLYRDEAERTQHESAIQELSEQFPEYRDLVRDMYIKNLQELAPEATIRAFISILVIKDIKGKLKRMKEGAH